MKARVCNRILTRRDVCIRLKLTAFSHITFCTLYVHERNVNSESFLAAYSADCQTEHPLHACSIHTFVRKQSVWYICYISHPVQGTNFYKRFRKKNRLPYDLFSDLVDKFRKNLNNNSSVHKQFWGGDKLHPKNHLLNSYYWAQRYWDGPFCLIILVNPLLFPLIPIGYTFTASLLGVHLCCTRRWCISLEQQ